MSPETISLDRTIGGPSGYINSTTPLPIPPPPSFADFQFSMIGRQPDLLKRISSRPVDEGFYGDSLAGSRSPSAPLEEPNQSLMADSSIGVGAIPLKRPTLLQALGGHEIVMNDLDAEGVTQSQSLSKDIHQNTLLPTFKLSAPISSTHQRSFSASTSYSGLKSSTQLITGNSPAAFPKDALARAIPSARSVSAPSGNQKLLQTRNDSASQAPTYPAEGSTSDSSMTICQPDAEEPSLITLRALQARLSATLSNISPVDTLGALQLAQSAKDQCTAVLNTSYRAQTLARLALSAAQEAMDASQECVSAAESVQLRVDEALDAVQKIGSTGGSVWERNESIKSLQDDLHQLGRWASDRELHDQKVSREAEARESDLEEKLVALALQRKPSPMPSSLVIPINRPTDVPASSSNSPINVPPVLELTVEDEADAATKAWNQSVEQANERKRIAVEGLGKRREVEKRLEEEHKKAQEEAMAREAELERARAELVKAEQEEKARQEEEERAREKRKKQIKQAQDEARQFRMQEQQKREEVERKLAEEKEKAQRDAKEKEARLLAEECLRREKLAAAKAKAQEEEDAKRREEQEKQRRQIQVDKLRANAEAASKIQAQRALAAASNGSPNRPNLPSSSTVSSTSSQVENTDHVPKTVAKQAAPQTPKKDATKEADTSGSLTTHVPLISTISRVSTSIGAGARPALTTRLPSTARVLIPAPSATFDSPPTTPSPREEILTHTVGPDVGNVPLVPPSQYTPISPEAQRANLRRLGSSNNTPVVPFIKLEAEEDEKKPIIKQEESVDRLVEPVIPKKSPVTWVSQDIATEYPGVRFGPPTSKNKAKAKTAPPAVPTMSAPIPLPLPQPYNEGQVAQQGPKDVAASTQTNSRPTKGQKKNLKPKNPPASASLSASIPSKTFAGSASARPLTGGVLLSSKPVVKPAAARVVAPAGGKPRTRDPRLAPDVSTPGLLTPSAPSLPPGPPAITQNIVISPATTPSVPHDFFDGANQMGPDVPSTGGWSHDGMQHEEVHDQTFINPARGRQARRTYDHYSPSPPPYGSRVSPPRMLRYANDGLYSAPPPPREIESRTGYARRNSPGPSRLMPPGGRGGSRGISPRSPRFSRSPADYRPRSPIMSPISPNYSPISPAYSPVSPLFSRSPSHEIIAPLAGRKRLHDDEPLPAPPARRSRYADQLPQEHDRNSRYSPLPASKSYQDDWSRSAAYGRSPSPEGRPGGQQTPLMLRMDPPPQEMQASTFYNSGFNSYPPPNNPRSNYNRPPTSYKESSNPQRRFNARKEADDSRPALLNRFTDSTTFPPQPSSSGSYQGNKTARQPKPARRGGGPALEQRISNRTQALINRFDPKA